MRKATLTILFILAMLIGLAAAPGEQVFRWEPNNHRVDHSERVRGERYAEMQVGSDADPRRAESWGDGGVKIGRR